MGTPDNADYWLFEDSAECQPPEPYLPVDIPSGELDDDFDSDTAKYVFAFTGAAMLSAISVIAYKRLRDRKDNS